MILKKLPLVILTVVAAYVWPPALAAQAGNAISYQGSLTDSGSAANGTYDLRFTLHDAVIGGASVGSEVQLSGVIVAAGIFNVSLDFGGGAFNGDSRWLEVAAKTTGAGTPHEVLGPRQALSPVPYALYAMTPAGPPGATGAVGPVGADGPMGSAGPMGPEGAVGPSTTGANSLFVGADQDADEAASILQLGTDGIAHVTVTDGGSVGVGTATPLKKLHVWKGNSGASEYGSNVGMLLEDDKATYLTIMSPDATTRGVHFGNAIAYNHGGIRYNSENDMKFFTGGAQERMIVRADGKVGIGTSLPASPLEVSGEIAVRTVDVADVGFVVKNSDADYTFGILGGGWGVVDNEKATERFRITGLGRVGIGISSPGAQLSVKQSETNTHALVIKGFEGQQYFRINQVGNIGTRWWYDDHSLNIRGNTNDTVLFRAETHDASPRFRVKSNGEMIVNDGTGAQSFMINSAGRIGVRGVKSSHDFNIKGLAANSSTHFRVGDVNDSLLFRVDPDGDATLAGTLTQNSDRRLKTDILPLASVLDEVMTLRPSSYRFKRKSGEKRKNLGFIAQEVAEVFPDVVDRAGEHLGLDYQAFGVIGIRAIQELKSQKDAEIGKLEKRNAELESRLLRLEQLMSTLGKVSE